MEPKWLGGAASLLTGIFAAGRAAMKAHSYSVSRLALIGAAAGGALLLHGLLNPDDIGALYAPTGASWATVRVTVAWTFGVIIVAAGWRVISRVQRHRQFNQQWPARSPSDPIPDRDPPKDFPWPWW